MCYIRWDGQWFHLQPAQPNSQAISYPADVLAIMPSNPCDGTPGDVGLPPGHGSIFMNGVYCISNLDSYDQKDIILNNATLICYRSKIRSEIRG